MTTTKEDLRAEIATLREELAAEQAKTARLDTCRCRSCGCLHTTVSTAPSTTSVHIVPVTDLAVYERC